jgi:asparagine synthase (glutamine-hydrolysing)
MCGITGYFSNHNDFNPRVFAKANNIITHRGPDGFGYATYYNNKKPCFWKDENLKDYKDNKSPIGAFGFRRLSIIDLSSKGDQPMEDITGNYHIIFNGEIYNYVELKVKLQNLGYEFKSESDTEVVLAAYNEWGESCVNYFNGMWSFMIYKKTFYSFPEIDLA